MPEIQNVRRAAVVRAQRKARNVVPVHGGKDGEQLLARAALANEHVHARGKLVARFVRVVAFVVGRNARGGIGGEFRAFPAGEMSVDRLSRRARGGELGEHVGVAARHAGIVHHFAQAEDVVAGERRGDGVRVQNRSAAFRGRGGNAGRHHHLDFERRSRGVRDHEIDAVHAAHVGDFVRVGDDGRRPAGHDRLGETRGNQLAAFDMDVRVDEAGQREKPAAVLAVAQIFAHGGDQTVPERDVGLADAARAHVEHAAVFQDFVEPFHGRFL